MCERSLRLAIDTWIKGNVIRGQLGTFEIQQTDREGIEERVEVTGTVYGLFGVYKCGNQIVTHIPTGRRVASFLRLKQAKQYVFAIRNITDWDVTGDYPRGPEIVHFCRMMEKYVDGQDVGRPVSWSLVDIPLLQHLVDMIREVNRMRIERIRSVVNECYSKYS